MAITPAVLSTAKQRCSPMSGSYWMEGKPAEKDIMAPDGSLLEKAGGGARRSGSYERPNWATSPAGNAVMDENDYMVRKWNEFIAA